MKQRLERKIKRNKDRKRRREVKKEERARQPTTYNTLLLIT
jgi:hypothetical protein